jgi:hypothetical protein
MIDENDSPPGDFLVHGGIELSTVVPLFDAAENPLNFYNQLVRTLDVI